MYKRIVFFISLLSSFFFFSCDSANIYLSRDVDFSLSLYSAKSFLAEGAFLAPGTDLEVEIWGTYEREYDDLSLSVSLAPLRPAGAGARALDPEYAERFLIRYSIAGEKDYLEDNYFETDGNTEAFIEFEVPETETESNYKNDNDFDDSFGEESESFDEYVNDDFDNEIEFFDESDEPEDFENDFENDFDNEFKNYEDSWQIGRAVGIESEQKISRLSGRLPAFTLPEDIAPGPYILRFFLKSAGSTIEQKSFVFFALQRENFSLGSLVCYPPGKEVQGTALLDTGTMVLCEALGLSPENLDAYLVWYFAGKKFRTEAFKNGLSLFLYEMPEESGLYKLKVELYPYDPDLFPSFPYTPEVKTLTIALGERDSADELSEYKSDVEEELDRSAEDEGVPSIKSLLTFPLRGKISAQENAETVLLPLHAQTKPLWLPAKDDFGLFAGPKQAWYFDPSDIAIDFENHAYRIEWTGLIRSNGEFLSSTISFTENKTVFWSASKINNTLIVSFVLPQEEQPYYIIYEDSTFSLEESCSFFLDFEVQDDILTVFAKLNGDDLDFLKLSPLGDFVSLGPLCFGPRTPTSAYSASESIILKIVIAEVEKNISDKEDEEDTSQEEGEKFLVL